MDHAEKRRRGERGGGRSWSGSWSWENGFAITSLAAKNAKSAKGWGLYFLVLDLLEEVAFATGRSGDLEKGSG